MRLEMVLPHDIPTLEARNTGNWTRPDNVWCCADSPSPFITCNVRSGLRPVYTDHLPIVSTLDLTYTPTTQQPRFNFKEVDWDAFQKTLSTNLNAILTTDLSTITDAATLEEGTNQLFDSITRTIQEVVPQAKISPHTKRWWNRELNAIRRTRNCASTIRYRWRGLPDHPSHDEYRKISRSFARAIEKAKAEHWNKWIKHIGGDDIWSIHHYMRSDPTDYGKQRIPNILNKDKKTYACSNSEKAQRLAETFFPPAQPPPPNEHQFEETHPPRAHGSSFPKFTAERVTETCHAPMQNGPAD